MSEADVTFVIDGNDAGLAAAVSRGVRSLRRLDDEMDEVRASTAQADSAMRGFAGSTDKGAKGAQGFTLSAEKMGQGLSLVSPRLGELTAKIGGLGAAGGPLVAAAAGATAFGAAWAGVVVSMVDAVRNIDDLTEALTEQQRVALDPYIENVEALRDLFDSIGGSLTESQIRILSGFANGVREIAVAVSVLTDAFNRLDDASRGGLSDWIGRMLAGQSPLLAYVAAYGSEVTPGEAATVRPGTGPLVDEPTAPGTTFNMEEDARRRAAERARSAGRNTASNRPAESGWRESFGEFDASLANLKTGIEAQLDDLSVRAVDVWIGPDVQAALQHRDELSEQYHLNEMERIAERRAADQEALSTSLALASNTIGAMGDLWGTLAGAAGASAREVWGIQKAAAVAQAALAIPLAALEGLKSGGPAAPALAAVYGALAAIQFATVAATPPPKFHSGGMLSPDEQTITVRTNERLAVLTAQGADQVARMNAGREAQQPAAEYYFIDRYGMRRAERFARPRPELAVSRRGGW